MSDPADLIREADAALAQEAANEGGPIVDDPATLVRRLRDALEAERAALAEERVTVLQWQQECRDQFPDLDDNCGPDEVASAVHMLRVERNNAFAKALGSR